MASTGAGDSHNVLQTLLSSLLWKNEVLKISLFKTDDNIHKHLFLVEQKIEDLGIPNKKQDNFLRKTLHQDVLYEVSSLSDFNNKIILLGLNNRSLIYRNNRKLVL